MLHSPRILFGLALSFLAVPAHAQGQSYTAELLGPGILVNDMNASGQVVGWTTQLGNVQAYLNGPGGQQQILPLPPGYASAWAQGINDAGVVVGSVATGSFPEFGRALAWIPDGQGGFTTQLLGELAGHTQSVAYDVNNRGDIVGWSFPAGQGGGPTVWFNSPSGVMNLSALGAPSGPKQINDEGVVVGISGGLFDIDTLTATPLPPFPSGWSNFQGWSINEQGELAGTGIHGSKRSAAIWTQAGGWQSISPQFDFSASVQAFHINDAGLTYAEVPAPAAYAPGAGTKSLASLLVPAQQGQWSFLTNLGGAVNDAGQIAAIGIDQTSGQSGVVLLTPSSPCPDPSVYCSALANSSGAAASIAASGTGSLAANSLVLSCSALPAGGVGVFFHGTAAVDPGTPFGDGLLCIGGNLVRLGGVAIVGGAATQTQDLGSPLWAGIAPGDTRHVQFWFRDPSGGPAGFNLSNALTIPFCE